MVATPAERQSHDTTVGLLLDMARSDPDLVVEPQPKPAIAAPHSVAPLLFSSPTIQTLHHRSVTRPCVQTRLLPTDHSLWSRRRTDASRWLLLLLLQLLLLLLQLLLLLLLLL